MEIVIAVTISLINMEWGAQYGYSVLYCNVYSIVMGAILIVMPFYIWLYYGKNLNRMDQPYFREHYGRLYDGLDLRMGKSQGKLHRKVAILYLLFFILKRIAILVVAILLAQYPVF